MGDKSKTGANLSPKEQAMANSFRALIGEYDHRLVLGTLRGFESTLKSRFPTYVQSKVRYEFTRNWRNLVKLTIKNQKPPFLFIGVENITVDASRINLNSMRKSGFILRDSNVRGISKTQAGAFVEAKVVPLTLDQRLRYFDTDALRTMQFGIELVTTLAFRGLTFDMNYRGYQFQCGVRSESLAVQTPDVEQWIDFETDASENTQSFIFPVRVTTWTGMFKSTPVAQKLQFQYRSYASGKLPTQELDDSAYVPVMVPSPQEHDIPGGAATYPLGGGVIDGGDA